ncbi:MAG TPA: type I polyketide synthase, partial [Bryobacteraceae bacterium]|nr:type I polyketide synthase [Bryobacteraceae bacterium]
ISPHPVLGSAILQTVQRSQKSVAVLGSLRRNEDSRENMLDSLARLYTSGQNIAWSQVYDRSHNRVGLPHYPWRRQRYWFDQLGTGSQELSKADDGKAHPLLGERVDAAGEEGLSIWQTEIDATNPPYLADHRVRGEVLFPGAASAEMLLEAAAQLFPGCKPSITGITFESPLRLETGKPRQVQLLVSAREGEANASLYSRPRGGNGPWTRHVTGKLQSAAPLPLASKVSIARIKTRCSRAMVPEEHYHIMEAHGLEYGPSFRSIRRLWCGDGEALAEIGPSSASQDTRYQLHPTLLDSCLQTVAAAIRERANSANNSYLPFGFKSWQMAQPAGDHFWCHARLVTEPGSDTLEANLDLIAEDGRLIAKLEGLSLRRLPTQTQTLKDHLLELRWDAKPLDPQVRRNLSGKWLIFGGSGALADDLQSQMTQRGCQTILAQRGDTYRAIDGTHFVIRPDNREDTNRLLDRVGALDGILHLWSLDAHSVEDIDSLVYGSSLHLIQSAAKLQSLQRLIFVTSQAQPVSSGPLEIAQSPLWGLTLVANQERPELNCACIDLDAANARENAAILLQEMETDDSEKRTGWRKGVRYAVRLVKTTLADRLAQKITSAANGTFLITGGLGALGLLTAEALVSRGVRHLALVSRRAEDHPSLEQLRRLGAQVNVLQADVAQLDQAEKVFAKISADMPPLKGVIHAAGVLEDGVLDNQSLASFQCVCAPKIKGAWNLHLCSKNHPVEVFVCFSSAASLVGSSGQANYAAANAFLDAFAHHRRSLGLPACSINWSIWNEAGMGQKDTLRRMSARGIMPIEPSAGLNLFCDLVENDPAPPQIGVFPVEWPKFLAQYSGPAPKLFEYFLKSPIQRENFRSQFSIRLEDRALTLTGRVQQLLAMTLAIDPSTHISSRERFFELGMDSLTAMEFRNRLQGDLGVTLPSTLAFDYPTLDALTSYLKTLFPVNTEKPAERNESADSELDALSHDELVRLLALELGEIRVNAH